MIKKRLLPFVLCLFTLQFFVCSEALAGRDWKKNYEQILRPSKKKPARTAVLIIAPPTVGDCYPSCRWQLGKKVWEQYMNSHPDVDCYFLQATSPRNGDKEEVWLEGNTIYVGDPWYKKYQSDRILLKTVAAIEYLLPHYTHFFRTNLNTFMNLKALNEYAETHHQSMYTGPLWQDCWYVLGYGVLFTADVASHIASEYRRLEGQEVVNNNRADDGLIASLATGLDPYTPNHPFRRCPSLPDRIRQIMSGNTVKAKRVSDYGILLAPPITLKEAIGHCEKGKSSVMLYRTRHGIDVDDLARLYEYLLHKNYPELPNVDLVGFANSLPTVKEF